MFSRRKGNGEKVIYCKCGKQIREGGSILSQGEKFTRQGVI